MLVAWPRCIRTDHHTTPRRLAAIRRALLASAMLAIAPFAARAETIDDSMNWALRSSLSVRADDERQAATEARLRGSIDAFMPSVAYIREDILSSKYSYTPDYIVPDLNGLDTVPRREPNISGFQATLPLFDGFRRYNNYRSARIAVDAGRYMQVDKRQQTYLDAATAYLAIIRDRKLVGLRKQEVGRIAEIAKQTKTRLSLQQATLTDVDIAQSRLIAANAAVDQAAADLQASEIEYVRITGTRPGATPAPRVPVECIPVSAEQFEQALIKDNPRLQASRLSAIGAGYDADAKLADVLPQVNLIASSVEQTNISEALFKARDNTVKVQMRVPIYEPGAFPRIHEAAALARQASWQTADNQQRSVAAGASLYVRYRSTIALLGRAGARVKAMQRAVDGYSIERAAGFRTIIDILNAENELTDAEMARVNLEFERDNQVFSIAASLARLGPAAPAPPPAAMASLTR
jgi:outer membrane protein